MHPERTSICNFSLTMSLFTVQGAKNEGTVMGGWL